jgi:hypothetical protein
MYWLQAGLPRDRSSSPSSSRFSRSSEINFHTTKRKEEGSVGGSITRSCGPKDWLSVSPVYSRKPGGLDFTKRFPEPGVPRTLSLLPTTKKVQFVVTILLRYNYHCVSWRYFRPQTGNLESNHRSILTLVLIIDRYFFSILDWNFGQLKLQINLWKYESSGRSRDSVVGIATSWPYHSSSG